jgi:hypothetical protein
MQAGLERCYTQAEQKAEKRLQALEEWESVCASSLKKLKVRLEEHKLCVQQQQSEVQEVKRTSASMCFCS